MKPGDVLVIDEAQQVWSGCMTTDCDSASMSALPAGITKLEMHWHMDVDFYLVSQRLCRRFGFSEASYYLWRGKLGGMEVLDAKPSK